MLRTFGLALVLVSQSLFAETDTQILLRQLSGPDTFSSAKQLLASGNTQSFKLVQSLIEGHLYRLRSSEQTVVVDRSGSNYQLFDPLSGASIGIVKRRDVRRISITAAQRAELRTLISRAQLRSENKELRLLAVGQAMKDRDPGSAKVLMELLPNERDGDVKVAMRTAIELIRLRGQDSDQAVAAAQWLSSRSNPEVIASLSNIAEDPASPALLTQQAVSSLQIIESRISTYEVIQTVFFGLSLGSVLVLTAIGLSITFGVMGVINMAHGELMMIGAYTTYVVQLLMPSHINLSLFVAIPAAFVVSGLIGVLIERGIIRFLYDRPLETLLATFGVSLILQQAIRSIFSPLNRTVITPDWMSGSLELLDGLSFTYNRLYIMIFCLALFAALLGLLKHSRFGLQVRAVSQNRSVARSMGVRSDRIDALTFGLGSGIAGVAGVALSQLTNVGPNLGQAYIVESFLVVVMGGVGNLWGTLVAGLSIGVANKILEPTTGAVVAKIIILLGIILFIQKRPRGLFPQKGRGSEG